MSPYWAGDWGGNPRILSSILRFKNRAFSTSFAVPVFARNWMFCRPPRMPGHSPPACVLATPSRISWVVKPHASPQEVECIEEVRFAGGIWAEEQVQLSELQIHLAEALEVFNDDTINHRLDISREHRRSNRRLEELELLPQSIRHFTHRFRVVHHIHAQILRTTNVVRPPESGAEPLLRSETQKGRQLPDSSAGQGLDESGGGTGGLGRSRAHQRGRGNPLPPPGGRAVSGQGRGIGAAAVERAGLCAAGPAPDQRLASHRLPGWLPGSLGTRS